MPVTMTVTFHIHGFAVTIQVKVKASGNRHPAR
jgi:hypothetical protein